MKLKPGSIAEDTLILTLTMEEAQQLWRLSYFDTQISKLFEHELLWRIVMLRENYSVVDEKVRLMKFLQNLHSECALLGMPRWGEEIPR